MRPRTRLIAALCGAVAAATTIPATAQAILVAPAANCPDETALHPFAPWNDNARYVRVDDGGFEAGAAGWALKRARVIDGNHPWPAVDAGDRRALALRGGASATTPPFCIGLGHPTLRFFARRTGSPLGVLLVQVVATTTLGIKLAVPVGVVGDLDASWRPTAPMLTVANLLTLLPGGKKTRVAFRFTAIGVDSGWEIDDVFVDPYAKR